MTDAVLPPITPPGVAPASRPPRRRAPKAVWWLLGLLVAGLLAVWLLSPWWTLARMQRALASRDAATFSAFVDYPAVRESLKPVVAARVRNELLQQVNRYGGAGAVGSSLGGLVAQVTAAATAAAVDTAVTPAGLMALMMGAQARDAVGAVTEGAPVSPAPTPGTPATPPAPAADPRAPLRFHGGYEGLNRFGVTLLPPSGGEIRFVMQRRGFAAWRLVEIVPPA